LPTQPPIRSIGPACLSGQEVSLNCNRTGICAATMVMLVCLRVATGWHFFKEGMSHRFEPNWSSAGFLQQAKGPLAMHYQAVLPKFHDWDRLILAPLVDNGAATENADEATAGKDAKASDKTRKPAAYDDWLKQFNSDWKSELESFTAFYNLDSEQQKQAADLQKQSATQMEELMKGSKGSVGYGDDIRLYRQLAYRAQMMQAVPGGGEIPFVKNRAVVVQKNPVGEVGLSGTAAVISSTPAEWKSDAQGIESLYHKRLADLLTDEQRARGELPSDSTKLHKIDKAMPWFLMAVGGCLVVGLFTRLAASAGALFLLSIVCSQPPWISGTIDTYYQVVEMFALLALVTTNVGRWAGLDYFLHLLVKPLMRRKAIKETA
jgi:uncharacterized membrane protein YphA (DoxX/SURF4 family)